MTPVHQDELYAYDGLNRLTSLDRGDLNGTQDGLVAMTKTFGEAWTLDPVENWTNFKQDTDGDGSWDLNQDRTHNKANEIATIASSSSHIAYDRAGNMTRTPKPDNWSSHFDLTFDAWNRLVMVEDGDTSYTVAKYEYDGANRRTLKQVYVSSSLDHTCHYHYSRRWQILEERIDSANSPERQYVWGLRYIDDLILRDRDADDDSQTGNLGIASSGLEERLYAMQDPNWNVTAIADTAGNAQERYRYSAYGLVSALDSQFASTTATHSWTILYTGALRDQSTSLMHLRRRCFVPTVGCWLQRDSIQFKDGLNLIAYATANPVTKRDPMGRFSVQDKKLDEIPAEEATALKGCACRRGSFTKDESRDTVLKEIGGYVECDGKGHCRPVVASEEQAGLGTCYSKCHMDKCVRVHEEHHIKQIAKLCPGACKDQAEGGIMEIFAEDLLNKDEQTRCHNTAECYAYKAEFECLRAELAKFKEMESVPCVLVYEGEEIDVNCAIAVDAMIDHKKLDIVEPKYKCSELKPKIDLDVLQGVTRT